MQDGNLPVFVLSGHRCGAFHRAGPLAMPTPYRHAEPRLPTRRPRSFRAGWLLALVVPVVALAAFAGSSRRATRPMKRALRGAPASVGARPLPPLRDVAALYSDGAWLIARDVRGNLFAWPQRRDPEPNDVRSAMAPVSFMEAMGHGWRLPDGVGEVAPDGTVWKTRRGSDPWRPYPGVRRLVQYDRSGWMLRADGAVLTQHREYHPDPERVVLPWVPVRGVPASADLFVVESFAFVRTLAGEVWGWRIGPANGFHWEEWGETNPSVPSRVEGLSEVTDAVRLRRGLCTVARGALRCVVDSADSLHGPSMSASRFIEKTLTWPGSIRAITAGGGLCTLHDGGRVFCARFVHPLYQPDVPREITELTGAREIVAYGSGVCGRFEGGTVRCHCWSSNCGTGGWQRRSAFEAVTDLPPVADLAVLPYGACARTSGAEVWCWGWAVPDVVVGHPRPTRIQGLDGVVQLRASTGEHLMCALKADDSVWCWGGDHATPYYSHPTRIGTLEGARTIVVGWAGVCALNNAGRVRCWARDGHDLHVHDVASDEPLTDLVSRGEHFCALGPDRRPRCWAGQQIVLDRDRPLPTSRTLTPPEERPDTRNGSFVVRPDGTVQVVRAARVDVSSLRGVTRMMSSERTTCALHEDGSVSCAGDNGADQLGTPPIGAELVVGPPPDR